MITKERLEELIKEKKQIWKFYKEPCQQIYQIPAGLFGIGFNSQVDDTTPFDELFETKEDAEEYAEFGNITRTERLELNSYETFLKSNTGTMFYLNACEHLLHKVRHSADDENPDWRIEVCVFYNDLEESSEVLYSKPLTRENYNEARRLCVKLFKGEDV